MQIEIHQKYFDMPTQLQSPVKTNLTNYEEEYESFSWQKAKLKLAGLPKNRGLNIAYEAVDRHAQGPLKDTVALRWILKDRTSCDFTYEKLQQLTSKFANILGVLGVKKGETVFTLTGRIPELYITALGTLKKTAVFCPLYSVFGPEPIQQRLTKGEGKILVTTSELYERKIEDMMHLLPDLQYVLITDIRKNISDSVLSLPLLMRNAPSDFIIPETMEYDPALLHFTSGTTGMPKGAVHVHGAVLTHYITGKYVLDFQPGDVFWCTADPGWVTGTSYGIISPLVNGVTSIFDEDDFDAKRWYSILEEQQVNIWYTSPTAIRRLMRIDFNPMEVYNLGALREILSVGEPLNKEAVIWGQKTFGVPILDNWWQTETGGIMIANYPSMKVKPGSMGKPLPGIEAAIAIITETEFSIITDPNVQGHLVLKKNFPSIFKNYLHEEERYNARFHDDWYITGDLAKKDADGYFWFVGRADDVIKTSGHMVGPFEVESALMEHPAVDEAAVIGIPDPTIGELVKAFIVLKKGSTDPEELKLDILGFARNKLGSAIAPKQITYVENLPKTRSGKVLRRLLKARELGLPEGDTSTLEKS